MNEAPQIAPRGLCALGCVMIVECAIMQIMTCAERKTGAPIG